MFFCTLCRLHLMGSVESVFAASSAYLAQLERYQWCEMLPVDRQELAQLTLHTVHN
jgi:hypothetical protein